MRGELWAYPPKAPHQSALQPWFPSMCTHKKEPVFVLAGRYIRIEERRIEIIKKIPYRQLIRRKMEPLPWFGFNTDKSAASTEQKRQILGKWMWLNAKIAFAWQEKLTFPFYLHGIAFIIWILCYFCLCFIALVLCYLSNVIIFVVQQHQPNFPAENNILSALLLNILVWAVGAAFMWA